VWRRGISKLKASIWHNFVLIKRLELREMVIPKSLAMLLALRKHSFQTVASLSTKVHRRLTRKQAAGITSNG
jgi:hypothetical protein